MPSSYNRWRIYVTAVDGDRGYASFSGVGFFASNDGTGTNLATTRIAQSQSGDGAVGPASAIFNGGSEGGSSQPLPYWVSVQWASPITVGSVSLSAQRVIPGRTAKDFTVQGSSDGVTWFDVYSKSGETGWVEYETRVYSLAVKSVDCIATAGAVIGSPSVKAALYYSAKSNAPSPLGSALAFAFSGHIAFAAADTPLGSVSALSVVVSACRIASSGPLGVPATLARYSIAARVSAASPLGIAQPLAFHDFTGQIGDTVTRYVMDLITPSGTVRVPISSWQATLRTGASSYVQCVIPAAQPWGATINAATSFRIYRRAVTTGGQVFEYLMAEAPADTQQFDRGPTNPTCTLSGYAPGFAGQDVSPGTDRTLTGIRSISSGASYRVRCAVDWLLRPGQRGVVDGVPFVVEWINYYVNTNDAYMEVGT